MEQEAIQVNTVNLKNKASSTYVWTWKRNQWRYQHE